MTTEFWIIISWIAWSLLSKTLACTICTIVSNGTQVQLNSCTVHTLFEMQSQSAHVQSESSPIPADVGLKTVSDKLKEKGNVCFGKKQYADSIRFYSEALQSFETAVLYSNRSAAYFFLDDFDNAKADAERAVHLDPSWLKGKLRLGQALLKLGRPREAATLLEECYEREPGNAMTHDLLHEALAAASKRDRSVAVSSSEHFLQIFENTTDPRLRLCTMATYWNESPMEQRYAIFHRFLAIIAGPAAVAPLHPGQVLEDHEVHISQYKPEQFGPLPMENYFDITVPETWIVFYNQTLATPAEKLDLFNRLWDSCSPTEQTLIVADFQQLYGLGAGPDAADTSASHHASANEDTDDEDGENFNMVQSDPAFPRPRPAKQRAGATMNRTPSSSAPAGQAAEEVSSGTASAGEGSDGGGSGAMIAGSRLSSSAAHVAGRGR